MKNILKSKFFVFTLFFTITYFIFTSYSSAYSGTTKGGVEFNVPDISSVVDLEKDNYFLVYRPKINEYRLFVAKNTKSDERYPFHLAHYADGGLCIYSHNNFNGTAYKCVQNDSEWSFAFDLSEGNYRSYQESNLANFGDDFRAGCDMQEVSNNYFISSNFDIFYKADRHDENSAFVVFQLTPATTKLGDIVKVATLEKNPIQEILGILPLIIVVVVSLVGLRKALAMLLRILRTS